MYIKREYYSCRVSHYELVLLLDIINAVLCDESIKIDDHDRTLVENIRDNINDRL